MRTAPRSIDDTRASTRSLMVLVRACQAPPRLQAVGRGERPACPTCTGHGLARTITIKNAQRTIGYECELCHREWSLTMADSPHI